MRTIENYPSFSFWPNHSRWLIKFFFVWKCWWLVFTLRHERAFPIFHHYPKPEWLIIFHSSNYIIRFQITFNFSPHSLFHYGTFALRIFLSQHDVILFSLRSCHFCVSKKFFFFWLVRLCTLRSTFFTLENFAHTRDSGSACQQAYKLFSRKHFFDESWPNFVGCH